MNGSSTSRNLFFLAASVAVLAGCGAEEIASPGSGGNITINNPAFTRDPGRRVPNHR